MGKKKMRKQLKQLQARVHKLENPTVEVRTIGFQQLSNLHAENDYDWEDE